MSSINILLIEDNPGDVELTTEALHSSKIRNQLQVVTDGEQALDYLFQRGLYTDSVLPNIIILDLNLPKVDGREVLAKIKSDEIRKSIPIIILSSSKLAKDIEETYELHANCFISKPVQLEGFMKVIQMIESFWTNIVLLPPSLSQTDR